MSTQLSRRAVLARAVTATSLAAVPIISSPAIAKPGVNDETLFAAIAAARALVPEYHAARDLSNDAYDQAYADPDMPAERTPFDFIAAERERGSTLKDRHLKRLYEARVEAARARYGASRKYEDWCSAGTKLREAFQTAIRMRANTVAGIAEKLAMIVEFRLDETGDIWDTIDFLNDEHYHRALADLRRLTVKA